VKKSSLILIVMCGLLLGGCGKGGGASEPRYAGPAKNDVDFAKDAFHLLGEGDQSVEGMIDWEQMNMVGVADVGSMYRPINGESGRRAFRKSFIAGYSKSFKGGGGTTANLTNWREQSRDASRTVVAADGHEGKMILITVAHADGQQKVTAFELK
jgi:hypothetical protein